MSLNSYTIAYAVGYYYGRAFPADAPIDMKEEDLAITSNQGFQDGLLAGRHDYVALDLTQEALSQ